MRNSRPIFRLALVILVFIGLGFIAKWFMGRGLGEHEDVKVSSRNSLLQMELEGVILNGKKFLKNLKDYRDDKKIKGVLVVIDSPGGSVGPSQEIFAEIKRVHQELKKPVICFSNGIVASGAYYAAAACEKLVVAPGSLIGSIGVIMQFANLEKLYDWAKVQRYSITSGKYKDSGAEYRAMTEDERHLFQEMITEVYEQFKTDVMQARGLKEETMKGYADGRVFTGQKAVDLGFADQVGTYEDAVKLLAEKAGVADDYEIFEIPKKHRSIWDFGEDGREDPVNTLVEYSGILSQTQSSPRDFVKKILNAKFLNQPMLLMPGFWE